MFNIYPCFPESMPEKRQKELDKFFQTCEMSRIHESLWKEIQQYAGVSFNELLIKRITIKDIKKMQSTLDEYFRRNCQLLDYERIYALSKVIYFCNLCLHYNCTWEVY